MKKIIRTTAMVAILFATATGMASEPKLSVTAHAEAKSLVYELNAPSGETTIRLSDADNHVIYSESIDKKDYTKKFDLKNLEDGLYFFTTEDSLKIVIYTINLTGADVKITERKENYKPVYRKENGLVYLNLLNLTKREVEIDIYDSANRLLFSEKRENDMIVEKTFNFAKAHIDRYTVVVHDGDNTYYEGVVVR